MLHGIIKEQVHCLDVTDGVSDLIKEHFHVFPKSYLVYIALI